MKIKPSDVPYLTDELWEAFNLFADNNGIGSDEEDWKPWFEFWYVGLMLGMKAGYNYAQEERGIENGR
jgi:hypothetical protein